MHNGQDTLCHISEIKRLNALHVVQVSKTYTTALILTNTLFYQVHRIDSCPNNIFAFGRMQDTVMTSPLVHKLIFVRHESVHHM